MKNLLIVISVTFNIAFIQASFFPHRHGQKLNFDVITYLNSDDQLAQAAIDYMLKHFNGQFKHQAHAVLSFTPDLALRKAEYPQYWQNQIIYYGYQLQKKGVVVAQGDPCCPPIYMQDKDQKVTVTTNGVPETAREISLLRRVDIDKYVISYVINIVREESIAREETVREISCNADDLSIKVPITLKGNDSRRWNIPLSCYYPDEKEEIELHEGMLSKPNNQASQFEPLSIKDLLVMACKNPYEKNILFLKLVSASFLDPKFDRFPRESFFIKCIISAATKKEDPPLTETPSAGDQSEQCWLIKKIYHYKYPLLAFVCAGSLCTFWYFTFWYFLKDNSTAS